MEVVAKIAVLAVIFVVSGEALFAPKCLWSGLLGSSEESGERWLRDTTSLSLRKRDSRVRRFLWTDKDVCEWMCRDDYGSEVRDICRRCCPNSPTATQRPRPQTAATATASDQNSRAPRTTESVEPTTTVQASESTQGTTASAAAGATSTPAVTSAATSAPTTATVATPVPAGK